MTINTAYTGAYEATVLAVAKLVRQFVESGELRDRFAVFEKDAVEFGDAFELSVVLGQTNSATGTAATEHGKYSPQGFELIFSTTLSGQYAVTISDQKIKECVGDTAKQEEYAAELVQSLYQGWIRDKNTAVAAAATSLITGATHSTAVTIGTDTQEYATDMLTAAKTWCENLREGVTGRSYGNTNVGSNEISSRDIVLVMSNAMAALLDTYGYARSFNEEYLSLGEVRRVGSNKIADNTILVTDARNIQVRRKYDRMVGPIQNADGSYNMIYNKEEFIAAAKTSAGIVAFPYIVIIGTEIS